MSIDAVEGKTHRTHMTNKILFHSYSMVFKIRQDCLLQGQAQLNQRVVFRFVTLRLRGGGVSFDKNENHGLEMHVKSFEVFLDHALFFTHTPPPPCPVRGGEGYCHLTKMTMV